MKHAIALAVAGECIPRRDVDYLRKAHAASPRGVAHGRGPVSRLGSFRPGVKPGLRLSPHLAPIWHLARVPLSTERV